MNPPYATIRLEEEEGVGWLWFSRPKARNAISVEMLEELLAVLASLATKPWRALVLCGDGETFCSGLDLSDPNAMFSWLAAAGAGQSDPIAAGVERAQQVPEGIAALPYPTIAAIRGAAIGGGLELALACDLRIAARATRLALPEVTHGLVPDWGGTQRLPRLIGLSRATQLVLTGDRFSAEQAFDYGLVHRVVDASELETAAGALARSLSELSPLAVTQAKALLSASLDIPLGDGRRREAAAQSLCARSPDTRRLAQLA